MAVSSSSFGSPGRPSFGRQPGSKNKLRPLREDFDQLCVENFGSVEAGRKALAAHIWLHAMGTRKGDQPVKPDYRYLEILIHYWVGKPPEDLATQEQLINLEEALRIRRDPDLPANGTQDAH